MSELLSNFWVLLVVKVLVIAAMIPLAGMVIGFAEMKLSAKMQNRVGPYFAGGRWGWAAADRRRREVLPEGRPDPGRGRSDRLQAGSDARVHRDGCAVRGDSVRPDPGRPEPRHRDLLRARHQLGLDHRSADGRVVIGQQVLADGRTASCRSAHRLRAATGPVGGRRGGDGRHHESQRHRRGAGIAGFQRPDGAADSPSSSPSSSDSSSSWWRPSPN